MKTETVIVLLLWCLLITGFFIVRQNGREYRESVRIRQALERAWPSTAQIDREEK